MKDFIEYTDNGDRYVEPKRHEASEVLDIRLYCEHEGCNKYIKGKEGYNGKFIAETGQHADLRNECWMCKRHESENSKIDINNEIEVSLNPKPIKTIELNRYKQAILLVLLEAHPIPIHKSEIMSKIKKLGLLTMSEEKFKEYTKELKDKSKNNYI